MVDRRHSRGSKAPATPARRAAPAATQAESPRHSLLWWAFGLHAIVLFSIMVSMTAMTHNLDDIKVTLYFVVGPLLALSGLAMIWLKIAPPPPKLIAIGLGGYLVVTVVSLLASKFKWISIFYLQFNWIAAGFFISAMCLAAKRRSAEYFLRFMVIQILVVTSIGLFMYDLTGNGAGVEILFKFLFPGGQYTGDEPSSLFRLLITLSGPAQNDMQSTILSRDFYAGICLLYMPFPLLMMLDPGPSRRPNLWRAIAGVTTVFVLMTIFYCMSKGEWIFAVIAIVMFSAMFYFFGEVRQIERRHMVALIAGLCILIGSQLYLRSPTIMGHLKTVSGSFESREIIWGGAWGMFKADPILGGGPGTFRMYFPRYRRPDYISHEISHVTTYSHNIFLDLLAETGLTGFGMYMLMLGSMWLIGLYWAIKHPDPRIRSILVACLTSMVAIYGSNLSSPNARWVIGAVNLWTVMGFMTGIILLARKPGVERPVSAMDGVQTIPSEDKKLNWSIGALMAIGVITGFFAIGTGMRYWNSAVTYARGLALMEPVMDNMEKGTIDMETARVMLEKSAEYLEQSIVNDTTNVSAYYKLGSTYTTLYGFYKQNAEAIRAKNPADADKQVEIANNFIIAAKDRYEYLEKIHPDYAQIHYNLGIIYADYGVYLRDQAEKVKSLNPDQYKDLTQKAQFFTDQALVEMQKNFRMSDTAEAALALGNRYHQAGMDKEACEVFSTATTRWPKNFDLAVGYSTAAAGLGDMRGYTLALELIWNMDPTEIEHRAGPGYSTLTLLLSHALEYKVDDVLTRTLTALEKMNPADLRLFTARMELAKRNNDARELLRQVEMYRRAGGEGNQ